MTVGEKIKEARINKGMTQQELADKLGYKSRSSINKIEVGGRDIPRSQIVEISKILGVTPAYLMGWDDPEPSNITPLPTEKIRMIPIYESVSAGFGAYADDYITGYTPLYIINDEEARNTLCITVQGDSMYPKIEHGDLVQVVRQDWAENGQIAVVLIDGENGVVKKYEQNSSSITLHSINPEYPPKIFEGIERARVQVLGIVRKIIKSV